MAVVLAPCARTPLHHWHAAHGARFIQSDGWQIPETYSSVESELAAARERVGLTDLSAFAKISLMGKGVPAVVPMLTEVGPSPQPGKVCCFDESGTVLACRLTEDHLLLLALETNDQGIGQHLANVGQEMALVQSDVTGAYAGFALAGPSTLAVLKQLTFLDIGPATFPIGSCAETSFAGIQALLVRPPGTTLLTLQVYVAWDLAEYLWDSLLAAGKKADIAPIGLSAWRKATLGSFQV